MSTYKLKEDSDFFKRFQELCQKAEELEIDISWAYSNTIPTWVKDKKTGIEYQLKNSDDNEFVYEFPPSLEFKLTITSNKE